MPNRFDFPKEWENISVPITTYKKFPPIFLDNLSLVVRHGGYAKINSSWHGRDHNIQVTKIFYILKGSGHLIVEGEHYFLESGNFYIVPEGHLHSFYITDDNIIEKYWFHVNVKTDSADLFNILNVPVCVTAANTKKATEICKNLSDCIYRMQSCNANQIPISLMLNEKSTLAILIEYIFNCFEEDTQKSQQSLSKDFAVIINYIDRNLCTDIKIEKLAELVNMHPNYFVSKFKKIYSQTPHQMILNKKIEKAKELLVFTKLSISHIANYLGYNDIYYFSAQFKKITHLSPSKYRADNS